DQVILQLKSDWQVNDQKLPQGAVVSIPYNDLIRGNMNVLPIVIPDEKSSVAEIGTTKDRLLINMLENVKSALYSFKWNDKWEKEKVDTQDLGTISLGSADRYSNRYFFYSENFLEPSTLYAADAVTKKTDKIKS